MGKRTTESEMPEPFPFLVYQAYNHLAKQVERSLRKHLVSLPQANALLAIARLGDGATPSRVAEYLGLESHSVTGLLTRMETRGWVLRERNTQDRRLVRVALTDAGVALLRDVLPALDEVQAETLQGMSPNQQALLSEILHRLAE